MSSSVTVYAGQEINHPYKVEFLTEKNERLVKGFYSEFLARKFVSKLKHSKRCKLISYPLWK